MKVLQARTLRDIYNMSRKWIVKGKDTPLNVELKLTLDESSNSVAVEVLAENIVDSRDECDGPPLFDLEGDDGKDDGPSLFDLGGDDDKDDSPSLFDQGGDGGKE